MLPLLKALFFYTISPNLLILSKKQRKKYIHTMQYKIPVQVENEDPIFLGLSLRQLMIIMIGWGFAYMIFQSLAPKLWAEIALLFALPIAAIFIAVAVFKIHEMTFIPFILSLVRLNIFPKERLWQSGTDSFQPIDIWWLSHSTNKKQEDIDMQQKIDSIEGLQEKLKKI